MKKKQNKIFKGRIFSVSRERKTLPNGRKVYLEKVHHPGAVLVVPFINKDIILIRQYRGVIGKYIWELPAGTLEKGEKPRACAKRELAEETGYSARDLEKLGMIYTTPGFTDEKIYLFAAKCGKRRKPKTATDELIRIKRFTRKEIRVLFLKGRINDSKTVAALTFAGIL